MILDRYLIFGKCVAFNFERSDDLLYNILSEQLRLYPKADDTIRPTLIINVYTKKSANKYQSLLVNPSNHQEIPMGFLADFGTFQQVVYSQNTEISMDLVMKVQKPSVKTFLIKFFKSMEYTSRAEKIGQICFEWFLVPSVYFDENRFPLHASGFLNDRGGGILIGGTGGVGKTSIELAMCFARSNRFLCDDIAVVCKDGLVYPNLAYPKIYGYNMHDNTALKNIVFQERTMLDRFAWKLRHWMKGPSQVRRKVSPQRIFAGYENSPVQLAKYFILLRENRAGIKVEKIEKNIAIDMSIDVMLTEYWQFHNHIRWHEYNHRIMDSLPIIQLDETIIRWKNVMERAFHRVEISVIRVPINISHKEFMEQISDIIDKHI